MKRAVYVIGVLILLALGSGCTSASKTDDVKPIDVLRARTRVGKTDDKKLTERYNELFRRQERAWTKVEELARTSVVKGKTTDKEIQRLFGKPPVIHFPGNRTKEYHYLFLNKDGSMTSEYFEVYFNSDNRVKGWALGSG